VSLEYNPDEMAYQVPILPPTAQRNFLPGAGEGSPLQSLSIHFEGVIRVEGHLLRFACANISLVIFWSNHTTPTSVSPRRHHLLISTRDPPAIQQIAWPTQDTSDEEEHPRSKPTSEYATWILPEHEIPWLVDADGEGYHSFHCT
jgi:RAB6A-GEF complex partner protein 1